MESNSKSNFNAEEVNLRRQISECAGSSYNINHSANLLLSVNKMLAERSLLAEFIMRGKLIDEQAAINQFKYLNEQIRHYLSL